jgi:integrase
MPRKPQVNYWASRGAYYTQVNGVQHRLADGPDDSPTGPTFTAALEAYKAILTQQASTTIKDRNTVRAVLERFLKATDGKVSPRTFMLRRDAYAVFCDDLGERQVGTITRDDLAKFYAKMRQPRPHSARPSVMVKWGDQSCRSCHEALRVAFRWAVDEDLTTFNPVAKFKPPARRSRSARCLITDEMHARILATVRTPNLKWLLIALHATGARLGELFAAEAKDYRPELQAIVYQADDKRREDEFRHKTAGKGQPRVIRFTGESLAVVQGLVRSNPFGPIFKTRSGKPWTKANLYSAFKKLRRRLNAPDLIPYGYRHALATRWLEQGRSIDVLALILGNSPETIRRHYSHVSAMAPSILAALEDFRGGK